MKYFTYLSNQMAARRKARNDNRTPNKVGLLDMMNFPPLPQPPKVKLECVLETAVLKWLRPSCATYGFNLISGDIA